MNDKGKWADILAFPSEGLLMDRAAEQSLTLFQVLALGFLGAALAWEVVRLLRGAGPRGFLLLRLVVWTAAALAIAFPNEVSVLARLIGIGRGADVVLYVFVLAFLATSFYWYSRHLLLERQLTDVVRHLAIQEARRGSNPSDSTRTR